MANPSNTDNYSSFEEEITGGDIFRVVILTLLILLVGLLIITGVGLMETANEEGIPEPEQITEWAQQGVSGLPDSMKLLAMLIQASLIVPAWIYLRRKNFTTAIHLRLRPVPSAFLLYALPIGFCLAVVGDELSRLFDMIIPMPDSQLENMRAALSLKNMFDVMTLGLTVTVIAPFVEEALFRGFFQRWFERSKGVTSGVLSTSALFAIYHFNIYWLIPILLMATVLGAMAWRAESIWPVVVVHAVNNGLGLIAANTHNGTDPSWYSLGDHVAPWWVLMAIGVMVWSLRRYFELAERLRIGGHGPGGSRGTNVDLSA